MKITGRDYTDAKNRHENNKKSLYRYIRHAITGRDYTDTIDMKITGRDYTDIFFYVVCF